MLKRYQTGFGYLFRAVDAAVVVAAWLGSYWVRFSFGPTPEEIPPFDAYAALAPLVGILWLATFTWTRVYESSRMLTTAEAMQSVLKSHLMALGGLMALTFLIKEYSYSRLVMAYFASSSTVLLLVFRAFLLSGLRALRARGFNLRHVLAIGEGPVLEAVLRRLDAFPELGLRVRGVITNEGSGVATVGGYPVLGHFGEVARLVRQHRPDEVLVAVPSHQSAQTDRILGQLKQEMVDIRLVPDVNHYVALGCDIEDFDGLPVVHINDSPLIGFGALAKRATDFVLALAGLILISPLFLLIALLVKLTSPGPVFYAQERMGLDGRSFLMLKFRSMRSDAELETGPVWAKAVDNRRTAFGTFLRRTSLDELPQLFNVLRGDMSLVGPRPERPVFVNNFRQTIPNYMLRHKVKAGITGWAQVNGWRGDTSLERRIECDLFYIKNWSYLLDLKILTMTLWKGFINKNAY